MQYLTTEQALKDFDVFANQFQWANHSSVDFSPKKTPWVYVNTVLSCPVLPERKKEKTTWDANTKML